MALSPTTLHECFESARVLRGDIYRDFVNLLLSSLQMCASRLNTPASIPNIFLLGLSLFLAFAASKQK